MIRTILDVSNYVFWYSTVTLLHWLTALFLALCPTSLFRADMLEFFEDDCGIKVIDKSQAGSMDVTKKQTPDTKKYKCEIVVNHPEFFQRIAVDDFVALGEAYMEGWYECDRLDDLTGCLANGYEYVYPIVRFIQYAKDQLLSATNNQTMGAKALEVVETHYNLGNDLYQLMLDPSMNYTCAYWKEDTKTLEEAQQNKMDLIARKLNLKPGMKVLDIGSGFGAMAKYLAQNYGVSVTCYNISTEQVAFARKNCEGLDVTVIMEDYRKATGKYDRIYSIGFFEAVGVHNFREYYELCHRCLNDEGLTLLHSITVNESHPSYTRHPRWLTKYIFPNGEAPYAHDYVTVPKDLFVVEDMHCLGRSYAKTLLAWHKNFVAHWDKIKDKYESQQDGKFYKMWVFYLLSIAGLFQCRAATVHQTVYSKIGRQEEYKPAR